MYGLYGYLAMYGMHPKTCVCYQINFVGRLIGPGGANTKALQDLTGCKLSVLGRGTMKDKKKVQ